ncbi:VOC family protein [Lysinibacillus odysseyi]|uniref:Glyoxalase n=1 Tax=Lysinibacillus odysseyi 34hs-1 = NBRC 100172 TaxID=1220589 RepID=A0A0A3IDW4_9BACI|nr:VOC family protein [Lysinibacillus odysseyi]KGR82909.1 glyoxalase [Lysinibacillus odysseyi 34hs-1 = NBRC 100172]
MATHFHKKPNLYTTHVQLKVSDLKRSVEYYTTIIGFRVLKQTEEIAYLTVDGVSSLISLIEVKDAISPQGFTGLYHFALLLPTRTDLGNIVQHFIQHNIRLGAADHDVSEALYLNDPDGNGIEIYIDRPEQQWTWNRDGLVHMTTEQLNFQSILAEADGKWDGLPTDTVMGHIHLSVSDLEKTEEFYTQVLDYEVVCRYGGQALFVSTGNYHHHIGLNTWQSNGRPALPDDAAGLKSYTVVLKDETYADSVKNKLQSAGYLVEQQTEELLYSSNPLFSTVDPNGIRIFFTIEGN